MHPPKPLLILALAGQPPAPGQRALSAAGAPVGRGGGRDRLQLHAGDATKYDEKCEARRKVGENEPAEIYSSQYIR